MSAYGQNAENRERQVMGYLLNDGINEEGECNSYSLSDIANATGIDTSVLQVVLSDLKEHYIVYHLDDDTWQASSSSQYITEENEDAKQVRIVCEVCGDIFYESYGYARIRLATNDWKPKVDCDKCEKIRIQKENEYWDQKAIKRANSQIKKLKQAAKLLEEVNEDGNVYSGMHPHEDWYGNICAASRMAGEEAERMRCILEANDL